MRSSQALSHSVRSFNSGPVPLNDAFLDETRSSELADVSGSTSTQTKSSENPASPPTSPSPPSLGDNLEHEVSSDSLNVSRVESRIDIASGANVDDDEGMPSHVAVDEDVSMHTVDSSADQCTNLTLNTTMPLSESLTELSPARVGNSFDTTIAAFTRSSHLPSSIGDETSRRGLAAAAPHLDDTPAELMLGEPAFPPALRRPVTGTRREQCQIPEVVTELSGLEPINTTTNASSNESMSRLSQLHAALREKVAASHGPNWRSGSVASLIEELDQLFKSHAEMAELERPAVDATMATAVSNSGTLSLRLNETPMTMPAALTPRRVLGQDPPPTPTNQLPTPLFQRGSHTEPPKALDHTRRSLSKSNFFFFQLWYLFLYL